MLLVTVAIVVVVVVVVVVCRSKNKKAAEHSASMVALICLGLMPDTPSEGLS